ncbi:translin-associated factor X-interacting protein 1 isoform X2 [Octopus bimaculoides]|uniref:translin-associated factor X-interacting protein 1 isoform X2 n=1 Tax=Octopus bimaculoides TaxID=37653 RepID=UPI0022E86203|nr:translin-associated factor X-interacting protein 1 isoform X2 [Octopus bimaculoides]
MSFDKTVVHFPSITSNHSSQSHSFYKSQTYSDKLYVYYRIRNSLHQLPIPSALKPYCDRRTGELDTWPCSFGTLSENRINTILTKSKSLLFLEDRSHRRYGRTGKAKLLEELERYLQDEIAALGGLTNIDFIDSFKAKMIQIAKEYEDKLEDAITTEKPELVQLHKQNEMLRAKIGSLLTLKEETALKKDNLVDEIKEMYGKYRDTFDSCRLLMRDIKTLEAKSDPLEVIDVDLEMPEKEEPEEDIKTLKIILKMSTESAEAMEENLQKIMYEYAHLVPRRDIVALEKQYEAIRKKKIQLLKDIEQLRKEYNNSRDVNNKLAEERNECIAQCHNLSQATTNLPWQKSLDYTTLIIEDNKNTHEQLLKILEQMKQNGARMNQITLPFKGKGFDKSVPIFLRHEGKVFNRAMSRRECALLINSIWKERINDPNKETQNLSKFVHVFLCQNYPIEAMRIEWAYNLYDSCSYMSQWNENLKLFWEILNNEIDEGIYHSELLVISTLLTYLRNSNEALENDTFTRSEFQQVLTSFFSLSPPETVTEFIEAASKELQCEDNFQYEQLFTEDDEGNYGIFLSAIREYVRKERMQFVEKVKAETADKHISVKDLENIILKIEPEMNSHSVEKILHWVFKATEETLPKAEDLPQADVLSRLKKADIKCSVFNIV